MIDVFGPCPFLLTKTPCGKLIIAFRFVSCKSICLSLHALFCPHVRNPSDTTTAHLPPFLRSSNMSLTKSMVVSFSLEYSSHTFGYAGWSHSAPKGGLAITTEQLSLWIEIGRAHV